LSRRLPLAAAVAVVALGAGVAGGRDGSPQVDDVRCVRGCAGPRTVAVGSAVRFEGRHLGGVNEIRFAGENGAVATAPLAASARAVKAEVPAGAVTGRPRLVRGDGAGDLSPFALRIVPPSELPSPGSFELDSASARPRHAYFYDGRPPRLRYRFAAAGPREVVLRLVRRRTGNVARRFVDRRARPYSRISRHWRGLGGAGGVAPDGGYKLRIGIPGGAAKARARFLFHGHRFPVRGPHSYGDGIGAGRGHQGQDIRADCGTPLMAARGGRVAWKAYQGGGYGYYLVIDGRETSADYLYAHLPGPAPLRRGARVHTGQRIGLVGATGNATGCHLHFELWPRGWRRGGFASPTDDLRAWDSWS
jgi:murein DD-endopeptidase MepM/ murein hydrolase activator NlpD